MQILKYTKSLCGVCYKEVVANVSLVGDEILLYKFCPEHGNQTGVIEIDPFFYMELQKNFNKLYQGHFVDVTNRCNLNCKYCFHPKSDSEDISIESIWAECALTPGPYIFTGGEPTIRTDLPEILARCQSLGELNLLTNGFGFIDKNYLAECCKYIAKSEDNTTHISLSIHQEASYLDTVLDNFKFFGHKLYSAMFVIDTLDQLPAIVKFAQKHRGVFSNIRIRIATNIWNESRVWESGKHTRLYSSQIIKYFESLGPVIISKNAKIVFTPFIFDGIEFIAGNWYDVHNIDLLDLAIPPTYRAKNGEVTDFVRAMLINEGVNNGWLAGTRL